MASCRPIADASSMAVLPRFASTLCTVLLLCLLACPGIALAAEEEGGLGERHSRSEASYVTITELVRTNADYNGAYVEVEGEAVGDIINGDDSQHCWVNLSSGDATIGVYMSVGNAAKVKNLGRYGVEGTTLAVYGIYHIACNEGHEGELDIHADIVEIKSIGGAVEDVAFDRPFAFGALGLVGIGLVLLGAYVYLKRYGVEVSRKPLKPRK